MCKFFNFVENRRRIKKNKIPKIFTNEYSERIIKNLPFNLTKSQIDVFNEINLDLLSKKECLELFREM